MVAMWFSCVVFSLAAAASFTNPYAWFPHYQGNRAKLDKMLAAAGDLVDQIPKYAESFDELFSHDLLVAMYKSISDRSKLSPLLEDLSPDRFDELCDEVQFNRIGFWPFIRNYPNDESKWKKHQKMVDGWPPPSSPFLPNFRSNPSDKYAKDMEFRSADIIDHLTLDGCIEYWINHRHFEPVREACLNSPLLDYIYERWLLAYAGKEADYVAMLVKRFERNWYFHFHYRVQMPADLNLEHLQPLADLIESCMVWKSGLLSVGVNDPLVKAQLQELNEIIEQKRYLWNNFGGDYEPFLEQWSLECKHFHRRPKNDAYPRPLSVAAFLMESSGNEATLRNSLAFASQFEESKLIYDYFYAWLDNLRRFTPRVKQAFALFKPYLPEPFDGRPSYRPRADLLHLYHDMVNHPEDYWPAEIKEYATRWAIYWEKTSIEAAQVRLQSDTGDRLLFMAADPNWREQVWPLLRQRQDTIDWNNLLKNVDHTSEFTVAVELWKEATAEQKDSMKPFWPSALVKAQVSMALSANLGLLAQFLQVMSPPEIVNGCSHLFAKRRIAIMLHLHPEIQSYHKEELVNKNSLRFRDWVMFQLPCAEHKVADLKLLDYFFNNRTSGAYPSFVICDSEETEMPCWLGLLGNQDRLADYERIVELSFEPKEQEKKNEEKEVEAGEEAIASSRVKSTLLQSGPPKARCLVKRLRH